jgi:UDP:flavonoid glycosyltransferase YjiC (YdhE family)
MTDVRVLFASLGAYGHLYPMMPLALAAQDADHEVLLATGDPFLTRLPLPTVPAYTGMRLEDAIAEARERHPDATGVDLSIAMFADVAAEATTPTLLEVCGRFEPDLVVYEGMMTGAGIAADLLEIPAAAFAVGLARMVYPMLHGATLRFRAVEWERRGRPLPHAAILARALIDPAPPSFGPFPDAPVIPIRSVAYAESASTLPPGWDRPAERPRVFLTLGTVSFGAVEVLRRAAAEIAALDVELLVAVGPDGDPTVLDGIPGRITVERFVAQSQVLPRADVFVHHGGTGSVLGALAAGLPQVILPQGADQFLNADTLAGMGAARVVQNDDQRPDAIGDATAALLGDPPERRVAARIAAEIASLPAPPEVVPRLVGLAG